MADLENEISSEIYSKIMAGWSLLEESCLICGYSLLSSLDNEKVCFACKTKESKNFLFSVHNQINELKAHFKKLPTPSKIEAKHQWKSIQSYMKEPILAPLNWDKFSITFEKFLINYFKKGFKLTKIKCFICNYNLFKAENDPKCLKCLYDDEIKNQDQYSMKLKKFVDSLPNIDQYKIDKKEIKLRINDIFSNEPNVFHNENSIGSEENINILLNNENQKELIDKTSMHFLHLID